MPTPTDLAADPVTGLLRIPADPSYSELDRAFISYLETLNGFPASSTALATFSASLDPSTVTADTVEILDLGLAPLEEADSTAFGSVSGIERHYVDAPSEGTGPAQLALSPPGGEWSAGHTYAVALIGGSAGLKGAQGEPVVGTSAWALMRSSKPLVTCEDLSSPDCRSVTDVLPVDPSIAADDTAARLVDQAKTAVTLERIRRHYKPVLDYLDSRGHPRADVALLWTFRITDLPMVVFAPAARPPRVPLPTDLAIDPATGLISAPLDPSQSPAEQEFIRDYLNTLTGFPPETPGSVDIVGGDLDPSTATAENLRLLDLSPSSDGGSAPVTPVIAYDAARKRITLTPPGGVWPKGRTFGVAVIAGPDRGLRMTDHRIPIGSEVWALLRGTLPITSCIELENPDCRGNLTLAPIARSDAIRLETIRRQLAPHLDALEAEGFPRSSVAVLWTFTIAPNPEAFFDPANQIVPFPNDIIRTPADGGTPAHVNVPLPDGGSPSAIQLITQLNSLDGFSTTAFSVSETNDSRGVLDVGELDAGALDAGIGFFNMTDGSTPPVTTCLNCASTRLPDGGTPRSPQQLQFVPRVPLQEQASYVGYLTTDVRDTQGLHLIANPALALLRSSTPLVDEGGRSLVSVVTDEQARLLEPARLSMKPAVEALVARGIERSKIALAWGFTTQSTRAPLEQLYAFPRQLGARLPTTLVDLVDRSGVYKSVFNPYPSGSIRRVFVGHLSIADTLVGPGGTSDPARAVVRQVPFVLTTPTAAAPASGYPVVIWGHPFTASSISVLGIANALAGAGKAMIALDLPWHGARTTCIGARDALTLPGATSDNDACQAPAVCNETTGRCESSSASDGCIPGTTGDLTCQNANQGFCVPDNPLSGHCEGPSFKLDPATHAPVVSGWNFLSSNMLATRDSLRQYVVDIAQLERVIEATGAGSLNAALGTEALDKGQIHFVGMSMGGMVGALSASVSTKIHRVVLNASGADLPTLFLEGLTPEARAFFLAQAAANGLTPGTPAFDQFLGAVRWAMDAGDPANHVAFAVSGSAFPADRRVLIQYIHNDPIIPNTSTRRLIDAANTTPRGPIAVIQNDSATLTDPKQRHAYLISQDDATLMSQAQQQVVTFIQDGGTP